MKEFITKMYECDFCTQNFTDKDECLEHEINECLYNPKTKNCMTCANKKTILLGKEINKDCIGIRFECKKKLISKCIESEIYSKSNCQFWENN